MRARFTNSIASVEGWSYGHGQEVLVAGDRYEAESVPESVGRVWLSTGLLEPVEAPAEVATVRPASTTVHNAVPTRRPAAPRR